MNGKTWGDVLKDPALIITFWITGQFFVLILIFNWYPGQMGLEAKQIILQAYVVAFTAGWGYWLGSSAGSKMKDEQRMAKENNHGKPAATAA